MNQSTHIRRHAGFSLIEVMVVLVIMAILLLIALPVFSYITAARSTESGTNLAAAMIGRARTLALNRQDTKYIGVLFYSQPDEDRDVLQLVELEPTQSTVALERYASWQQAAPAQYYGPNADPTKPPNPDIAIRATQDKDLISPLQNRPIVKHYIAKLDNSGLAQGPPTTGTPFSNTYWDINQIGNVTPVLLDTEAQNLPQGVRIKVMKRIGTPYASPGIILFDKQGHVSIQKWGIVNGNNAATDGGEMLLKSMGQPLDSTGKYTEIPMAADRVTGLGLAIYNEKDLTVDKTDATAVNNWVDQNATQLTVAPQSGELVPAK